MKRALLVLAAVLGGHVGDAVPCSISMTPAATVFRPASGAAIGHQPWISLWQVPGKVQLTAVPATCPVGKKCPGPAIPFHRAGAFLRPRAPLAPSTRFQVTSGATVLADETVSADPPSALAAWQGAFVVSARPEPEGLCSRAGPVVRIVIAPTHVSLDRAVVLIYLATPDPARPLVNLARVLGIGGGAASITLDNHLGEVPWLTSVPHQLWIALADGDGHIGPPIALAP